MTEPYDRSRRIIESFHSKKYFSTAIDKYEEFPDQFLPTVSSNLLFPFIFNVVSFHVLVANE